MTVALHYSFGRHNSFRVDVMECRLPRVAPSSQPWANRLNPFGINSNPACPIPAHPIRRHVASVYLHSKMESQRDSVLQPNGWPAPCPLRAYLGYTPPKT